MKKAKVSPAIELCNEGGDDVVFERSEDTFADDLMDSHLALMYRIRDENAALKKEITKLKRELGATTDAVNTWMHDAAQETEAPLMQ